MADSDKVLELLIEFKAKLDGLNQSRTELLELKRQAVATGVSTTGLDDELEKLDKTLATLAKKELPEAHEGVAVFNTHGRDMHRLLHELNKVAPGLGLALRSVFNPAGIGIAVAVVAVQQLVGWMESAKKKSEELKKNLEEMPELAGLLGQTAGLADAMLDAQLNTEKFFDGLQRSHDSATTINSVLEQTNTLLKAQATAEDEIAKKQKERELAQIEFLHSTGQLSDAAAIAAKAATEQDFSAAASQRKIKLDQTILDKTVSAASVVNFDESQAKKKLPGAEEAAALAALALAHAEDAKKTALANYDAINSKLTGITTTRGENGKISTSKNETPGLQDRFNQLPPLQRQAADRFKTVEDYNKYIEYSSQPIAGAEEAIQLRQKIEELRAEEAKWKRQQGESEAALPAAKKAAQDAASQLAALTQKISSLQTQADALDKQIKEKKAVLATDKSTAATVLPIENEIAGIKEANDLTKTGPGKALIAGEAAAQRLRAGTQTKEDAANIIALASQMAGQTVDLQTAVTMMEAAATNTSAFVNLTTRLAAALEKLTPANLDALTERISQLEYRLQLQK